MKTVIFQLLTLALLLASPASSQLEEVGPEDEYPKAEYPEERRATSPRGFRELGTVNGKVYHAEATSRMTWVAAKAYCEASNMELASIETKSELDFLSRVLAPLGHSKLYWTSAHESRPVKMIWDGTHDEPDTTFLSRWFWEDVRPYQYCATFSLWTSGHRLDFDIHRCDSYQAYVLCQSQGRQGLEIIGNGF